MLYMQAGVTSWYTNHNLGHMDIPTKTRGIEYKVQYQEHGLYWKDIQRRHSTREAAEAAAYKYSNSRDVNVRLMEINMDTGKRQPITLA